MTWRDIARQDDYKGVPAGTLCAIAKGYEPKSPDLRARLGLPLPTARVIPVQGVIPDGAQAFAARRCECGQWFIPNGTRKRCFNCSPSKARRENGTSPTS